MPFGVYVHIPFCAKRCDYCDFATWTDRHHLMESYTTACLGELELAAGWGEMRPASSVFFGGGTPSLLPPHLLARILGAVEREPGAEVTVECNPDTITAELLDAYTAAGVTRISVGAQSMRRHVLDGLGRQHGPTAVEDSVRLIGQAGFASFNVDLIFGGPGETDEDWRATLEAVLSLEPSPPHVSAYALTPEPGTPLGRDKSRHPDEDSLADRYAVAEEVLSRAGLGWYEISNWARPGHECRHNLLYWEQGEYRGIGCAAHSHVAGRRFWNVRTPERYIAAVERAAAERAGGGAGAGTRSIAAGEERLTGDAREWERLELLLRTRAGVPEEALPRLEKRGEHPGGRGGLDAPEPLHGQDELDELEELVERRGGRAVLTLPGRLLANEVALRLTIPESSPATAPSPPKPFNIPHPNPPPSYAARQILTVMCQTRCARVSPRGAIKCYETPDGVTPQVVASLPMNTSIRWLSTKEASEYLGVNLRTLYRFIDEGDLVAYKFGRVIRLQASDVDRFIESSRIVPGTLEHLHPEPVKVDAS